MAENRFPNSDAALNTDGETQTAEPLPRKLLTPAAQRALAEAAERRAKAEAETQTRAVEHQGPKGPEPTRFGDWERKGIASDF